MESNINPSPEIESEFSDHNELNVEISQLYTNEFHFYRDAESRPWKKLPWAILQEFELTLQTILVKGTEPSVAYSEHMKQYLIERSDRSARFDKLEAGLFGEHYFVACYSKPIPEDIKNRRLSFAGGEYMYLYEYNTHLVIKRSMTDEKFILDNEFDLLFAFSLRQCDLMKLSAFLKFHLQSNFKNNLSNFKPYLTQLTRKYSPTLFSNELTRSIEEWLAENKIQDDTPHTEKVKTNLSVDKLSYLFRVLVDLNLVSPENKALVIRMITNNFQSKMRENLSQRSVEDKFYNPSDEAIAFWKDQFIKMLAKAEKDQRNNLK